MQPTRPPLPSLPPQTIVSSRTERTPVRAKFTDQLLYAWGRLRPTQREAAWKMVETMRATMAQERIRRRRRELLLSIALAVVATADGVIMYLAFNAHAQ
jgi:hypothetical protein